MNKKIRITKAEINREISKIYDMLMVDDSIRNCIDYNFTKYMQFRVCIKHIFDLIENVDNEHYVGILEWAFTQEIMNSVVENGIFEIDKKKVFEFFWDHTDICELR